MKEFLLVNVIGPLSRRFGTWCAGALFALLQMPPSPHVTEQFTAISAAILAVIADLTLSALNRKGSR